MRGSALFSLVLAVAGCRNPAAHTGLEAAPSAQAWHAPGAAHEALLPRRHLTPPKRAFVPRRHLTLPERADPTASLADEGDDAGATQWCRGRRRTPHPDRRIYATWQSFPLTMKENGIDGELRILEDSRFTKRGAKRQGTTPLLPPCDPLPARLQLLDAHGKVVRTVKELPETDIAALHFAANQTVYEVRGLFLCLAGCWCGDPVTYWQVKQGRLRHLHARLASGREVQVGEITQDCYEGSAVGTAKDGLEISIHRHAMIAPNPAYEVTDDERYWWDGTHWRGSIVERRSQ